MKVIWRERERERERKKEIQRIDYFVLFKQNLGDATAVKN